MKSSISLLLVLIGFGFQASAGGAGVQRTFDCVANEGPVKELTLVYSATVYAMPAIGVSSKTKLPFATTRFESNTVLGLDFHEILNTKQYAESGSSVEVSAPAEEMNKNNADVVVRIRNYNKGLLSEQTTAFSCRLVEHKDLNF
jgi:hypothetical protein